MEVELKVRELLKRHLKNVLDDTALLIEYAKAFELYSLREAIESVLNALEELEELEEEKMKVKIYS
jgi:hypothetical protein